MLTRNKDRIFSGKREWQPSRFWYYVGWVFWTFVFTLLFPLRVRGAQYIPSSGPLILASNHLSGLDPFVLARAIVPRWPHFLAKEELFRIPLVGHVFRQWGAIPIDREAADVGSARIALQVLRAGEVLAIFPERTRSATGQLQELQSGTVNLALKKRVPILPAGIAGTDKILPRGARLPRPHSVRVVIGPPLRLWEMLPDDSHQSRVEGTRILRKHMADLVRQAQEM